MLSFCLLSVANVSASELSDSIGEQLENIDLSSLEEYFNSLETDVDVDFKTFLNDLLNGGTKLEYNSFFGYIKALFLPSVNTLLPAFLTIIGIGIFLAIFNNVKGNFASDSISNLIFFVGLIFIGGIIASTFFGVYQNSKNTIENMAKLVDIVSPIMLTLMIASGGTTSATVYKPAVLFLSQGIIKVFSTLIITLILIMMIFSFLSNLSPNIKLKKYNDFFGGIIKWVVGITVTVFSLFLTVQGITSATFDGISIKATKYAISNSIPMIGGFLRDGFDLVVAGSVIIKNAVGIITVFCVIFTFLIPIITLCVFSLFLKLTAAILEPIADSRLVDICVSTSKVLSYLIVSLLMVAFMIFITVLLMIFSANSFV